MCIDGLKLKENGFELIENTAEEILDLAKEMNEYLDGQFEYSEEDGALQAQYKSLIIPKNRCYKMPVRIGAKYLRENKSLLSKALDGKKWKEI
jgi:coenzyme F420-reducing hydrogenase alpha subunit